MTSCVERCTARPAFELALQAKFGDLQETSAVLTLAQVTMWLQR
jgi:hypothetical protein